MAKKTWILLLILGVNLVSLTAVFAEENLENGSASIPSQGNQANPVVPGPGGAGAGNSPEVNSQAISAAVERAQKSLDRIRDPFEMKFKADAPIEQVATQSMVPQSAMVLEGIGLGGQNAYAVLGGDVFYVGEEKNGIKLVSVRRGEAEILVNGETKKIRMVPEEDIKKAQSRRLRKTAVNNSSQATS